MTLEAERQYRCKSCGLEESISEHKIAPEKCYRCGGTMKDLVREDNRESYALMMRQKHTAQEIHNQIMEEIGNDPGTTPGYSKHTMAKILFEIRKDDN